MAVFFYGTLRHLPLLEAVLARPVLLTAARLPGYSTMAVAGANWPLLVATTGGLAEGGLLADVSDADMARLEFYETGFTRHVLSVQTDGGTQQAQVFRPDLAPPMTGAGWAFAGWQARWGDVAAVAAVALMADFGTPQAAAAMGRYGMLMVRAAARLRAEREPAAVLLRRDAGAGDVMVEAHRRPYAGFFAVEEFDLRHRRFDGTMSQVVNRTAFVSGDAATVLPYDPVRDRVLVIEQFRPGPFARGDRQPWQLEPIAGRIDAGETPEQSARREAVEEAGIDLGALIPIANYYPSPGAKTEFLYSFLGLADLPDGSARLGGLEEEGEDIRAHLLSFDDLMALVDSGEAATAPLILSALWLARHRSALREEAGAA